MRLHPKCRNVNPLVRSRGQMEIALVVVFLALVVGLIVVAPQRRAALEAAKEAKYREIRDAELDFRMGKLTDADYRTTDRELRAQAVEILRELDALTPEDVADPAR